MREGLDERRKFEFKCSKNWNGKFRQVNEVVSLVAKLRKREILFSGEHKTNGKLTLEGVSSCTCFTRERERERERERGSTIC